MKNKPSGARSNDRSKNKQSNMSLHATARRNILHTAGDGTRTDHSGGKRISLPYAARELKRYIAISYRKQILKVSTILNGVFKLGTMPKDPYRKFVAIYDLVIGPTNFIIKKSRLNLVPPIPGMKVLDVGCGTGADLKSYGEAGCEMYGIDLSPSMLERAQIKFGGSADLRLCDAAHTPFQDRFFDLVLSTYTLHEIPYKKRSSVINEMIRVVKDDGNLLLTDFHTGPIRFPGGWIDKTFITFLEILAGREHFLNGHDFLARGGLQGLINLHRLNVESKRIISGGNVALFLLRVASN